jgi:hypothetical protein
MLRPVHATYVTRHGNKYLHISESPVFFSFEWEILQIPGLCLIYINGSTCQCQPSQDFQRCMTCQLRHSRILRTFIYPPLSRTCGSLLALPSPVASFQYSHSSNNDGLEFKYDTIDSRGAHRLSCEHLAYLSPTLNSFNLQLAAEASLLSCICVMIIFLWIGVRPTFIRTFILFDNVLHSGTYIGIRRSSQAAIGSYFKDLSTSTWSASQFFCRHLID